MKKRDMILGGSFLAIALLGWLLIQWWRPSGGDMLQISIDGEIYGTYALAKEQTIAINDTNICQIKNMQVRMIEANCPDHLCMQYKPIASQKDGMIVCLPNRVVLEIIEEKAS